MNTRDLGCQAEARLRVDAATSILAYGLIGAIPVELAAEAAIRLLERAQLFLRAS